MTEVTKLADMSVDAIVAQVAQGLHDAAVTYGPDAVALALTAYRVDALQQIASGGVMLLFVAAIILGYRWLWKASKDWDEETLLGARGACGIIGGFVAIGLLIAAIYRFLDFPVWIAAFGHPELLIAIRALHAAGLL